MPFIEQTAFFEMFDRILAQPMPADVRWPTSTPVPALWAPIHDRYVGNYLCPSDGMGEKFYPMIPNNFNLYKVNYLPFTNGICEKDMWSEICPNQTFEGATFQAKLRGAFIPRRWRTMSIFTDGLSNSLVYSEFLTGEKPERGYGVPWSIRSGFDMIDAGATPNSSTPDNQPTYVGFCGPGENLPELNLPCTVVADDGSSSAAARSRHTGGVNGAKGDGSVMFISQSVDLGIYRSTVYISDGNSGL